MKTYRRVFRHSATPPALAMALMAFQPLSAQTAAGLQPASTEGEIVVTARRRSERLMDVPASISAFTSETLTQAGARTGADAVRLTSGVSIANGSVEAGDVVVTIRGLNGTRYGENSVAVVVDGIQRSTKAAIVQNQGILDQVEVLKGPQGAIYGRNATAGAFIITTRKPGDHLEGQFKASGATHNSWSASGVLSGPVTPNLGLQLGGDWSRSDGFYKNSFLPTALNQTLYPGNSRDATSVDSKKDWNAYGRAVLKVGASTAFDAKIRYGEYRGNALNFNAALQLPGLAADAHNPLFNIDTNDMRFVYTNNVASRNLMKTLEVSIMGTHDFEFAQLKGYVAHSNLRNSLGADGASGSFNFFNGSSLCQQTSAALTGFPVQQPFAIGFLSPPYSPTTCDGIGVERHDVKDWSGELRLIGTRPGPLQWQGGIYYINIRRRDCVATEADLGRGFIAQCYTTDPAAPTEALRDDTTKVNAYAAFGSVSYRFDERFTAQVDLRYDHEKHDSTNNVPTGLRTRFVGNPATGFPNGTDTVPARYYLNAGLDPAYNPSGVIAPASRTFNQVEPKVTLSYRIDPLTMIYANWGLGYKAGGFNSGGTQAIVDGFFNNVFNSGVKVSDSFDKETNSAFEAGIKGQTGDHALSYTLSGYYSNVSDFQAFEFFVGTFGTMGTVENIDKVRIYGFEGDVNWRVAPWLTLFAAANYTHSEIRENATRPYTVGNEAPYSPKYTVNIGGQIADDISDDLRLLARVEARVTGPTWFSAVQDNDVPSYFGIANFKNSQRDAFTTVDARIGLQHGMLSVSAFAHNLFDKRYIRDNAVTPEFGGDFVSPGDRRLLGIEAIVTF